MCCVRGSHQASALHVVAYLWLPGGAREEIYLPALETQEAQIQSLVREDPLV